MQTEIMMAAIPPPLIPPCFLVVTGVVSPLACVGVDFVAGVVVVGFIVVCPSLVVIQTYSL